MSFGPDASDAKSLVLDANILVRAILGRRVLDLIQEYASRVQLVAPDVAFDDVQLHLPRILLQKGLPPSEVTNVLETLLVGKLPRLVTLVPRGIYTNRETEARRRLAGRDDTDWPFVALALVLDCPIWTEDQDFFGSGVATWTTDRILLYLAT